MQEYEHWKSTFLPITFIVYVWRLAIVGRLKVGVLALQGFLVC